MRTEIPETMEIISSFIDIATITQDELKRVSQSKR